MMARWIRRLGAAKARDQAIPPGRPAAWLVSTNGQCTLWPARSSPVSKLPGWMPATARITRDSSVLVRSSNSRMYSCNRSTHPAICARSSAMSARNRLTSCRGALRRPTPKSPRRAYGPTAFRAPGRRGRSSSRPRRPAPLPFLPTLAGQASCRKVGIARGPQPRRSVRFFLRTNRPLIARSGGRSAVPHLPPFVALAVFERGTSVGTFAEGEAGLFGPLFV